MIIIAIILLLGVLGYKVATDFKKWLNDRGIDHKKEWWRWLVLAAECIPSITLFTIKSSLVWYWGALLSGAMCAWFLWLFFDGIYNKLRGFGWWYAGTDDMEDPITDNILQAIPTWAQIIIKVVPLGAFIWAYIYFL